MIIYHGISLILLAVVVLLVGMFKPKWILMWMDRPTRVMVAGVSMVIFMIGAVLFGEGQKQKQQALQQTAVVKPGKPASDTSESAQAKPAAPPAQAPNTSANDLRP